MWYDPIIRVFKIPSLRRKILFVLFMLVIFRAAAAIPVPGVDPGQLRNLFANNQLLGLLNIFSGGALDKFSVIMLGLSPYITATIIFQLLTMIFPSLKEMYQEAGEAGRRKFNQYARIATVPLAMLQGYGLMVLLQSQRVIEPLTRFEMFSNLLIVTAGTIFLMWIGELISERGIGNGVSILIGAGIIAGLPTAIQQLIASYDPSQLPAYLAFLVVMILTIAVVVLITEAQRNVPVQYAKRVRGFKLYGGASTYLPLRVNMAGVIPIIFAISVLLFPTVIANFLTLLNVDWLVRVSEGINRFLQDQWVYGSLYFILVVLFTYFYTAVTFDPQVMAENLQKQGGFIPGIRPGEPTKHALSFIIHRITLAGAVFLGSIAILPLIVSGLSGIQTISLGGTSLLIVVSVVLETMKQINAQIAMSEYDRV